MYKSLPKICDSIVDHNHVWTTKNIPLRAQIPSTKENLGKKKRITKGLHHSPDLYKQ
jgi:hypothetical protein